MDLSNIDEDPLVYFLTPTAFSDQMDDDTLDFEMDFDAGIEDMKHPPRIVRSVSPSSLEGLSLPPPRPPTPPKPTGSPDMDIDMPLTPEDTEDYMRFAARSRTRSFGFPFLLKDFTGGKSRARAKQGNTKNAGSLLSRSSNVPGSPTQGRSVPQPSARSVLGSQVDSGSRGRVVTSARRSPHSWREPSPDVWSIEEEMEDDVDEGMQGNDSEGGEPGRVMGTRAIKIRAAKPKKRVRFVLPAEGNMMEID
ncbi:hypothetical protein B0T22DRAFT_482602 [Podospora appendiculata]|uniref:Uncharacterized protein n=1 Tax=Podospora appendiculata TaxID=314037 RepID=A0AAE0X5G0_9PEZI|nr:hypothetical protein B0T22DRAFT_482602 [Podospora appendiculata]